MAVRIKGAAGGVRSMGTKRTIFIVIVVALVEKKWHLTDSLVEMATDFFFQGSMFPL